MRLHDGGSPGSRVAPLVFRVSANGQLVTATALAQLSLVGASRRVVGADKLDGLFFALMSLCDWSCAYGAACPRGKVNAPDNAINETSRLATKTAIFRVLSGKSSPPSNLQSFGPLILHHRR